MSITNDVRLTGRTGKDPEIKILDSGRKIANVSLATSKTYRNKSGERVTETQWHSLVIWGPLAEVFEKYVKKGDEITVRGEIIYRSYESDGVKKYVTEIVVSDLQMHGSRNDSNQTQIEDDLPF